MTNETELTRRGFLKLLGANMLAASLPAWALKIQPADGQLLEWPWLDIEKLPARPRDILLKVPDVMIDQQGYLRVRKPGSDDWAVTPCAQTLWNKLKSRRVDRLDQHRSWGIVLHWYGDKENFDKSVKGYIRGFDSLRKVATYITRTSAHFLVGPEIPNGVTSHQAAGISILQTQLPDKDGTPFVASHLMELDYLTYQENKQYFVSALNRLSKSNPFLRSLLQDLFQGPKMDPNMRTIAIEITGYDFENPEHYPSEQQIANVVGVVWAVMKRYRIPAMHILGHNEIKLGKPDPGKKFMALIRYLIGLKALTENNAQMSMLVFNQFLKGVPVPRQAAGEYFRFVRDYLMLVSIQRTVYEWEAASNYWFAYDLFNDDPKRIQAADQFAWPIQGENLIHGFVYLDPHHHEGVDFYPECSKSFTHLLAAGKCLFLGEQDGHSQGKLAVFRHRQPDGAEILSVYSHLSEIMPFQVGEMYPVGYPVGAIAQAEKYQDPYVHLAIAYGATWDTNATPRPIPPPNAGPRWIKDRYLNPHDYLHLHVERKNSFNVYS